jgi:hypothetical protein
MHTDIQQISKLTRVCVCVCVCMYVCEGIPRGWVDMRYDQPIPIKHTQGSRSKSFVTGAYHKLLVHSVKWQFPRSYTS